MKQVQAVVRPEKLDAVKEALVALGINGMTVQPARGFGQQFGHTEVYRGIRREARLLPKMMITTAVQDALLPAVLEAIQASARTGEIGDGKIIVTPLAEAIRIRTGEAGEASLG